MLVLSIAALVLPGAAWAQRRGGFHHRPHTVVFGSFFFGPPMWYAYHSPPYYYGPFYEASSTPPSIYVEKFEGQPTAQSGEIFCPAAGQYYPDVQECANGWQRIIRPPAAAQGG